MDDKTITATDQLDTSSEAVSAVNEQLEAPAGQSAVNQQEPTQQPTEPTEDELVSWASGKGFNLEDPGSVRKLAESYKEAEKFAQAKAREAADLKKSLSSNQVIDDQSTVPPEFQEFIADYRQDKMLNTFKEGHPDWQQFEPAMADILSQEVATPYGTFSRAQLVQSGFTSLNEVYLMAKGSTPTNVETVKSEAKRETLQSLANTQRASSGASNASNTNPQAPEYDPIMAGIAKARES